MPPYSQRNKRKRYKTKKLKSHCKDLKLNHSSKQLRCTKPKKYHKHSKFKYMDTSSDYVCPERLTNHVGFFTKGKISDSISRIEKLMPKEIKARARQDLREVLRLTSKRKHPEHNVNLSCSGTSTQEQSLKSSFQSPQMVCPKTGFSSNLWKDKLQKSIGVTSVISVLASVSEPKKKSPVEKLQHIARKIILTKIHPSIKLANSLLFPSVSNADKLKRKLKQMVKVLNPSTEFNAHKDLVTDSQKPTAVNSQRISAMHSQKISGVNSKKNSSSSSSECSSDSCISDNNSQILPEEEFHLNPIYTGEIFDQRGFTKIFPSVSEFISHENNLITDYDSVNLPKDFHFDYGRVSDDVLPCLRRSSSMGHDSTATLIPISPTTSSDSPAVKLRLSPMKFVPSSNVSPKLYFRHKMF